MYTDRLAVLDKINVYAIIRHMDPSMILNDRKIHYRERTTRAYGPFAYWVSIWLPRLPVEMLNSLTFSLILYTMVGLRSGVGDLVTFMFFSLCVSVCCFLAFSILAAVTPHMGVTLAYVTFLQISLFLLDGFEIYLPELPHFVSWLPNLIFTRYSYQGVVLNEFVNNRHLPDGQQYIHMLGFQHLYWSDCAMCLLVFIAVGLGGLYLALRYCDFEKR